MLITVLFHITFPGVNGTHNQDEIIGWTWSNNISKGSTYYWNVSEFSENNLPIENYAGNSFDIIEGSIISVSITENLREYDYLAITTITGEDLPFDIRIDDVLFENPDRLAAEFIYPNMVVWRDGPMTNLFYMDTPEYADHLGFSSSGTIIDDKYVIHIEQTTGQFLLIRDIDTGILTKWHLEYKNTILTYDLIDRIEHVYDNNGSNPINNFDIANSIIKSFILISPSVFYFSLKYRYSRIPFFRLK